MISNDSLVSKKERAQQIIKALKKATQNIPEPMSNMIKKEYHNDPFLILISCLLSLRSRDTVTYPVSKELFKKAQTPQQFIEMPLDDLEKLIHRIGFYRRKAQTIKEMSKEIMERFNGIVPTNEEELLSIIGIGRKTANLVRSVAFTIPALVVDTHVHKLSNVLGLVSTNTPEQTEKELMRILPRNQWIEYSRLLVQCGQNMKKCKPYIEPFIKKQKK